MKNFRPIEKKFQLFLLLLTLVMVIFLYVLSLVGPDGKNFFFLASLLFVLATIGIGFFFKTIIIPLKMASPPLLSSDTATRLKEAMDELKCSQRQIIQAETHKSLTSIVSGFAHEINNPLTGILGYIDLMEMNDNLSVYSKKRLERIKDQAFRIRDIIDDLNRLDPEIEQIKSAIDLSNLLDKLIKIKAKMDETQGILFEKDFVDDEIIIFGNHFALFQVFEGIIENSIDAIHSRDIQNGHIQMILRTDREHALAVIEIIDNGGGFENTEKAFNPFYTTKNRTQKRGIGLSIAFNLVQEHKGNIVIDNSSEGAVVTVYLPLYPKNTGEEDMVLNADNSYYNNIDKKIMTGGF